MVPTQAGLDAKALIKAYENDKANGTGTFAHLVFEIMDRNEKSFGDSFAPNQSILNVLIQEKRQDLVDLFMEYFCK